MSKPDICFLHLADTHFGVHYALKPRNLQRRAYGDLFFRKINEVIRTALFKHKVDFILHAGDFFNRSRPPPEVINRAVKPFIKAADKIPIFLLPGNHERSKLPLGLLFYHDRINLFVKPSSYYFEKNGMRIKITGFPYVRYSLKTKFAHLIRKAWNNSHEDEKKQPHYSILLIHQLIGGSRIENHTFWDGPNVIPFHQIPETFNLVTCGHVHRFQFLFNPIRDGITSPIQSNSTFSSIYEDCSKGFWHFNGKKTSPHNCFRSPVVAYSGSLERVSMAERNEAKGYIIGRLKMSENGKQIESAEITYHNTSRVEMHFFLWDLTDIPLHKHIDETLEKIYSIKTKTSLPSSRSEELSAVIRIKMKGKYKDPPDKLNYLKSEARRLNMYLSFSYNSLNQK